MRIDSSGNVGIGTSSPADPLHVYTSDTGVARLESTSANSYLRFITSADTNGYVGYESNDMVIYANNSKVATFDSSGNVGIGTDSPSDKLEVQGTAAADDVAIKVENTDLTANSRAMFYAATPNGTWKIGANRSGGFVFETPSSGEALRVDNSGNLLVGTTDTSPATNNVDGAVLRSEGHINVSRSGGVVGYFNRRTSDGTIIDLRKDGTTVGSIGVADSGDRIYLGGSGANRGIAIDSSASIVLPSTNTGGLSDGLIGLGASSARWAHLYLSGGVYLGGTGSANKLDDYEEGTWTPAFQSGDGCFSSVTSISGVSGNYTKVGNQVTAWYKFEVDQSITNAEGVIRIDGLPFATSFTNYGSGGAQLYVSHGSNNAEVASAGISNTTFYVYRGTVNGTTGTPNIQGFVTYQTGS